MSRSSHSQATPSESFVITHHGVGADHKGATYRTSIPPEMKGGFVRLVVRGEELWLAGAITIRREIKT